MEKGNSIISTAVIGYSLVFALIGTGEAALAQQLPDVPVEAVSDAEREAVSYFLGYNREEPLQAEEFQQEDHGAYVRQKIVFTGVQNSRVPSYLAIPKKEADSYPVVMLVDGLYGSKDRWFEEDSWPRGTLVTDALIDKGFATMALDMRYHGERTGENDYYIPNHWADMRDLIVPSVREHRRAIDYLETRDEIDTERLGVLGLSIGGTITFMLASVEPRVRAAAAGVTPAGGYTEPHEMPVAPQTYAGGISDVPFLMIMGRDDVFYSESQAEQLFSLIASPEKELIFYDSGHRLPEEYAADAVAWLVRHLN